MNDVPELKRMRTDLFAWELKNRYSLFRGMTVRAAVGRPNQRFNRRRPTLHDPPSSRLRVCPDLRVASACLVAPAAWVCASVEAAARAKPGRRRLAIRTRMPKADSETVEHRGEGRL